MATTLVSLLVIFVIALLAPIASAAVPHKSVPEVVFLLAFGALLGPHMAGVIHITDGVDIISELGLAFLFLIAGYEINPREFASGGGKTAVATWFVSLAVAFLLVAVGAGETPSSLHDIALAIALTTTAYGTLAPILKERGISETAVGKAITAHGVAGELLPIVAIALLLSTRASWQSILILIAFTLIAVVMAAIPAKARKAGTRLFTAMENLRDTNAQTLMRFVVVILLALITLCSFFGLDVVLGGFAAGFVLRFIMPEGDTGLEHKVEVVGFSFFIPVFFVVSGAGINLGGVFDQPLMLLSFMGMLILARTVPVYISTFVSPETRGFSVLQRLDVALYSTMALPLIVAICNIATAGGFMTDEGSSTLITAGALTVLITPVVTALTRAVIEAHPVATLQDVVSHPSQRDEVLHAYRLARHAARTRYHAVRRLTENPTYDTARDAAQVLSNFNTERLALLAEMRAQELQQTADVVSRHPQQWSAIVEDRRHRWDAMKERGDEAWERIKRLGDREIEAMGKHGEQYLNERAEAARAARDFLQGVSPKHAALFKTDGPDPVAASVSGSNETSSLAEKPVKVLDDPSLTQVEPQDREDSPSQERPTP